jgi:hypothetical protein
VGAGFSRDFLWNFFRWIHNQADLNLCPSKATLAEFTAHGFHRVKVGAGAWTPSSSTPAGAAWSGAGAVWRRDRTPVAVIRGQVVGREARGLAGAGHGRLARRPAGHRGGWAFARRLESCSPPIRWYSPAT